MRTRVLRSWLAAIAIAAALVLVGIWALPGVWLRDTAAQASARAVTPRGAFLPSEQALIDLFERARVSVVYITTEARVVDIWTRNAFNIPRGTGSGFAWDDRGHIVTNGHVIAGASGARVRLTMDAMLRRNSSASARRTTLRC
jgi:S1-C subfamily serine protease